MKGCRCICASFIPVSLVLSMGGLPVGAGQTVLYLELGRCNRESLQLEFSQTLEFQISLLQGRRQSLSHAYLLPPGVPWTCGAGLEQGPMCRMAS